MGGVAMVRWLAILALVFVGTGAGPSGGAATDSRLSVRGGVGPAESSLPIDKESSKIEFRAKATFAKIDGKFHEW
jgi:hypothetical protein